MFDFTIKNEKYTGKTLHDIGLVVLLCAFFCGSLVMANCEKELYNQNILMLVVTFGVAVLAAYGVVNAAVILAAVETVIFLGSRIVSIASKGFNNGISLLWIFVPALVVFGFVLIDNSKTELKRQNEVMKDQINQLVMVDELTGLYNLRSMYMDIQTQISYAERNNKQICLMILKPKYYKEIKKVLKKKQLEEVIIRLSKTICDTVRLEDKVYAIDSEGSFGVILTCDLAGSKLVEERLKEKLSDSELFEGIVEKNKIRVEMMLGCLEHKEEFARDAILFKTKVEEDLKDIEIK